MVIQCGNTWMPMDDQQSEQTIFCILVLCELTNRQQGRKRIDGPEIFSRILVFKRSLYAES